jgi:GNAT superfamily N-acetyltransferase
MRDRDNPGRDRAAAFSIRVAARADVPAIRELIPRSVRALSVGFYSDAQVEAALERIFGVDTQLIDDGTYFVAEAAGAIAGAGGWSRRRKLFGGDRWPEHETSGSPRRVKRRGPLQLGGRFSGGDQRKGTAPDDALDPRVDAARIRAFFVDPSWARRGIGRALLARCEEAARSAGFSRLELLATLPGVPLYSALGFFEIRPAAEPLGEGLTLPALVMGKAI